MPVQISNRRDDSRQEVPVGLDVTFEFDTGGGSHMVLPVTSLSVGGIGFTIPYALEGITTGAMLGNAAIRVGQLEIRGNCQIQHTTRAFDTRYECGAQFYPLSEKDRNELIGLVTRMESLTI